MLVDNHTHIRHIMLYDFEKGWKAAQSFRDLNELFSEQSAKVDAGNGLLVSNLATRASLEDKSERGETPGETQTFFLLRFLKRSHDSFPMTIFFRNGPARSVTANR